MSLLAQTPEPAAPSAPGASTTVKVAPHGSRWNYPKEVVVASGHELHIVEKGDTLWDLGTKYLGNPFAWPQIWELNKWVKDPHWIYPGDPILVDSSRKAVPAQAGGEEVADLQPERRRSIRGTRDEYAFSFQDFIQMPFLTPLGVEGYLKQQGGVKVVGRQEKGKVMQADGDVIYVNGGSRQGFKAGDRLVTMKLMARKFYHPDDRYRRTAMGDILQHTGVIRITHVYPNQSVAMVEHAMDGIETGSYAALFKEPSNIVASLRTDTAEPVNVAPNPAKIIFLRDNKSAVSGGEMVIVDQGSAHGLKVGDQLLVARSSALDPTSKAAAQDVTHTFQGQLVVVRTEEKTATCRLLRSKGEILVGDLATR